MNIWIVSQNAASPQQDGVMRAFYFARGLIRRGHDVTIVASSFNHRTRQHVLMAGAERAVVQTTEGIRLLWLRTPGYVGNTVGRFWDMLVFAWLVMGQTSHRLPRPDVVVGSSPTLVGAAAGAHVARRLGAPFVLEIRDLWPETLIDIGGFSHWHPVVLAHAWLERRLYRRAGRIVTVLPNAAAYMVARGATPGRIDVIANGIDLSAVPAPAPMSAGETFTVMYAGAHGLANGLDAIIDAAVLVQQNPRGARIRFRLIGEGTEKARLQARAASEGLTNLTFEDGVPSRQIHGLLAEADAFVANVRARAIYRYGISINKLFDYMAAGRPTAVAISAFNNPIAESGSGLSVPADDAPALADAILALATMSFEERAEMGRRARRHVAEHHDFTQLTLQLEHSLATVVAADKAGCGTRSERRLTASEPRS